MMLQCMACLIQVLYYSSYVKRLQSCYNKCVKCYLITVYLGPNLYHGRNCQVLRGFF